MGTFSNSESLPIAWEFVFQNSTMDAAALAYAYQLA